MKHAFINFLNKEQWITDKQEQLLLCESAFIPINNYVFNRLKYPFEIGMYYGIRIRLKPREMSNEEFLAILL